MYVVQEQREKVEGKRGREREVVKVEGEIWVSVGQLNSVYMRVIR